MNKDIVTILLVEDHAVVRAGFKRLIEGRPGMEVVAEAESGEAAGRLYELHHPAVVVMDLSLPGIGGLEVVRRLLVRDPHACVLVFSMHLSPVLVERALKAGTRGYVSKECEPGALLVAIERVAAGEFYLGPKVAQEVALDRVCGESNPLSLLSPREFEIFRFIAEGKTQAQIATQLHLSVKTIANNVCRIKTRLGVATQAELVLLAVRTGLIHP